MCAKVVILAFILCLYSNAETVPSFPELQNLSKYIERLLQCRNIPALAITLVKGDNFTWSRGFGYADLENRIPATNRTRFCIGSLSKAFTTNLLGQLLSAGRNITWDTPIREILGDNFRLSDDLRTDIANLRDLLAHKMGVPSYFNALLAGIPQDVSRKDLVGRLRYMDPTAPIRTNFLYNNYMYTLAGYIAEILGNSSWERLVREKIFRPLNMNSSGFTSDDHGFENFALPYVTVHGKLVNVSRDLTTSVYPAGPAGSIFSTAVDMANWIRYQLKMINNESLLSNQQIMAEIFENQMPVANFPFDKTKPKYPISDVNIAYTLGWINSNYRGYRKIWHSGGIISYTSGIWLFPDLNAGLFFSINGPLDKNKRFFTQELAYHVADLLTGEQPWMNMTTACHFPWPFERHQKGEPKSRRTNSIKSSLTPFRPLKSYEGTYGHPAFGNISITVNESNEKSLLLAFGRFAQLQLKPSTEAETFLGEYVGPLWYVTFADDGEAPMKIRFRESDSSKTGDISILEYPITNEKPTLFVRGLVRSPSKELAANAGSEVRNLSNMLVLFCAIVISMFG